MKHSAQLLLGLAASLLVVGAQAGGIRAVDVPRISNGSTGVIGGVEPDARPRQASQVSQVNHPVAAMHDRGAMLRTMPQAQAQQTPDTARMGAGTAPMAQGLAPRHQAWGTPD